MSLACLFEAERVSGLSEVSFQSKVSCLAQNWQVFVLVLLLGVVVLIWSLVQLKTDIKPKEKK